MAGMKRFIAYIYGYENAKKAGNTGFARIELRGEECRLEIHLRSVYAAQTHCRVYLFRKQGNQMEGSLIGEMAVSYTHLYHPFLIIVIVTKIII